MQTGISCASALQVLFNLANQYANNDMNTEALNTYQVIVKNKMFNNAGDVMTSILTLYSLNTTSTLLGTPAHLHSYSIN